VLGARPVAMAWGEVYTALQTNAIDGVEPDLSNGYQTSLHEVAKFISVSNYTTDLQFLLWNLKFWQSLPKPVQDILVWAGNETSFEKGRLEISRHEKSKGLLENAGAKVIELNDDELSLFKEKVEPVYKDYSDKYGDIVNEIVNAAK
jgi:TRAP-type C4-dicarboxylate transport system substrate-binding protein